MGTLVRMSRARRACAVGPARRFLGVLLTACVAGALTGCLGQLKGPSPAESPQATPIDPAAPGFDGSVGARLLLCGPEPDPDAYALSGAQHAVHQPSRPDRLRVLSPSKNIECGTVPSRAGEPTMACQIFTRDLQTASCSNAQNRRAGTSVVVYLTTTYRPTSVGCASDVAVPASPRSSVYGDVFAFRGGTRCSVVPQHVRCSNSAGHGFEAVPAGVRHVLTDAAKVARPRSVRCGFGARFSPAGCHTATSPEERTAGGQPLDEDGPDRRSR